MQAVILAGGLGKRLRPITESIPKAMVIVKGRPFLEYKLMSLMEQGVDDFVICIGYLGNKIAEYFGDGSKFHTSIKYSSDADKLLGPIGAIKKAEGMLDESFLVTYGDNYLSIDCRELMRRLVSSTKLAIMAVYHNKNMYAKSDVDVKDGFVIRFDKNADNMEWINYGMLAVKRQAIEPLKQGVFIDENEFYNSLIMQNQLLAYEVKSRFYEVGTLPSLHEFEEFIGQNPSWNDQLQHGIRS
ncbi:MAG: sugar phosphate nucleotidyltransferase [Conexivisphaerales archaeon]